MRNLSDIVAQCGIDGNYLTRNGRGLYSPISRSLDLVTNFEALLKELAFAVQVRDLPTSLEVERHPGGRQALSVFSTFVKACPVGLKVYKPTFSHLFIHTIGVELANWIFYYNETDLPLKIYFPKVYGVYPLDTFGRSFAVLMSEWVRGVELHKAFNRTNNKNLREAVIQLSNLGFIIDMLPKNWIVAPGKLIYIDMVLFKPNDEINTIIRSWMDNLGL